MGADPRMIPGLPRFVELPGASLPVRPPFPFQGMSVRLLPLRASLGALQRFVDQYLNMMPEELGRFRVPAPYVQLMLIDYGRMAIETGNYGWMAQREVMFNITLEWYKVEKGVWRFHDWATIAPYIYVDDDFSMAVGRTVYGWTKTTASLDPIESDWLRNPEAPSIEALVRTPVFSELYLDRKLEMRPLLQVERAAPNALTSIPPNPRSSWAPWSIAGQMAESMSGFARDVQGFMAGLGVMPTHPGASADNYLAMLNRIATMAFPMRPDLAGNTLNLKQFRRSENPDEYCFQAVTNGPMRFTAFNGGGVLGEQHLLAGDTSGGYSVVMHRWPSLPIIDLLGLEVSRGWRGSACEMAVLKPVVPIWYNVDMVYEPGCNLAWRTRDGVWRDEEGRKYQTAEKAPLEVQRLFNTTLGAANRTIAGAFRFQDTTIRVLPLLAYKDALTRYLDSSFNAGILEDGPAEDAMRLDLWGPRVGDFAHVYLVVTSIGSVTSTSNNIGDWAGCELAFLVPVQRRRARDGQVLGYGVVSAFTFVDNATAAAANAEVLGIPTMNAEFRVPHHRWMSPDGPSADLKQPLLHLKAEVMPVVGEGQKSEHRTILKIEQGRAEEMGSEKEWRVEGDEWANALKSELLRKQNLQDSPAAAMWDASGNLMDLARVLALDVLGNGKPISSYTIKQFRDIAEPDKACYQSLVRIHRSLSEVVDVREIEGSLLLRLHEYPTLPIVDTLGLVARQLSSDGGGRVFGVLPQRPFWISATVNEALGENLGYRAGADAWSFDHSQNAIATGVNEMTGVAAAAQAILDEGDARRLSKAATEWKLVQAPASSASQQISMDLAFRALELTEPQAIIEGILSREWGNWDPDCRWRTSRRQLEADLEARLAGVSMDRMADEEEHFFRETIHRAGHRPGETPVGSARGMADQLREFTARLADLETTWERLADLVTKPEADQTIAQHVAALANARTGFLEAADSIEQMPVSGNPDSPDGDIDAGPAENRQRFAELVNLELCALARIFELAAGAKGTPAGLIAVTGAYPVQQPGTREEMLRDLKTGDKRLRSRLVSCTDAEAANMVALILKDSHNHRDPMREIVHLARARRRMQRSALLNQLSRAAQKPDHVIWRGSAGPDRDRLFPMAQSWDEDWYVGLRPDAQAAAANPSDDPR